MPIPTVLQYVVLAREYDDRRRVQDRLTTSKYVKDVLAGLERNVGQENRQEEEKRKKPSVDHGRNDNWAGAVGGVY